MNRFNKKYFVIYTYFIDDSKGLGNRLSLYKPKYKVKHMIYLIIYRI